MPHLAHLISSNFLLRTRRKYHDFKRSLTNSPHIMHVFININDPYSYILIQALETFTQRFNIAVRLHTINNFDDAMFPEKEMWKNNAFNDASHLATLYGLKFPSCAPNVTKYDIESHNQKLLDLELNSAPIIHYIELFNQFWNGANTPDNGSTLINQKQLSDNEALLNSLGHYMSAMVYYAGEWYWGLDRLDHLEQRLNNLKLNTDNPLVNFNKTYDHFCQQLPASSIPLKWIEEPLTLYFSIRSPYSHLGLEHAVKLAQHYNIELIIKPVLPMVMRGLSVPNTKKMYIFHDCKREAEKHYINYGYVADPLGKGVERCYALYEYAQSKGKSVEYLLAYARAVNALGIRSDTDGGLKKIVDSCGLDWKIARNMLEDNSWTTWAESNIQEMYSLGLWGVPSFKYKNTAVWGQDRVFVIENEITNDIKNTKIS